MIEVEEETPIPPPPRAVRRTYGKPKQPQVDVDVAVSSSLSAIPDTSTDPITDSVDNNEDEEQENTAIPTHTPSSPLAHGREAELEHEPTTVTLPGLVDRGITWDGLKKGKHADWRKEIADFDHSEDDDDDVVVGREEAGAAGVGEEMNAYERAKALLRSTTIGNIDVQDTEEDSTGKDNQPPTQEAASSSLPPLTSDDPLCLPLSNNIFDNGPLMQHDEEEEETAPIKVRRRVVKSTTVIQASSTSSSSSSSGSKTPTRTTVRRRSNEEHEQQPTTGTSELPSSQPEYQRQLDLAREKKERRRIRREKTAAAEALGNSGEEDEADGGDDGLQTSPASPTMRRGLAQSGRRRRVVAASDEEEEQDNDVAGESTPVPARTEPTAEGGRKIKKRAVAVVYSSPVKPGERDGEDGEDDDDEDDEDEDGGFSKTLTNIFAKSAVRRPAPESPTAENIQQGEEEAVEEDQADADQDVESPTTITTRTTRRKGNGKAGGRKAASSGSEGSSADDAEARKRTRVKGLSKKEKELMNKEAAQMRAGKEVHLSRVRKEFTIASFITGSIPSLATKFPFKPISQMPGVPPLAPPRSEVPTQSSAVVPTPDSEIGQYSSQREYQQGQGHRRSSDAEVAAGDQTPTKTVPFRVTTLGKGKPTDADVVVVGSALRSVDSDSDEDDDGLGALKKMEMRARDKQEMAKRQQAFEDKQKLLKARKEAALKAQQQQEARTGTAVESKAGVQVAARPILKAARPDLFLKGARVKRPNQDINIDSDSSDNDDDLVILDKPGVKAVTARAKVERLNPREMLDVKREGANGNGKARMGGLRFAARADVMTESMFDHAGQTFDQAGKRERDGRTKSNTDTKLGRITDQQSLAFLLDRQKKMAAAEREKKERESGLKIRALQPRTQQLIDEETLEETRKAEEQRMAVGVDIDETGGSGDEDDSEDSDFAPVDEEEAEVANEEELLVEETQPQEEDQYAMVTPEEENGGANPLLTSAMGAVDSTGQETAEEALRQRKRRRLAVVHSDDEQEVAVRPATHSSLTRPIEAGSEGVPESSLVSRNVSDKSEPVGASLALGGFDDFGDGFGDSGGLSQFFNATQAPGTGFGSTTQINGTGRGLDALRQGTPAVVNLPGFIVPVVSATALARDMTEGAEYHDDHTGYTPRPQRKQYLNTQGLFTQTTPKMNALQGRDSMISVDEESLPFLKDDFAASSEELEPTYQSNGAHRATSESLLEEASTPAAPLSRLKRRRDEDEEDADDTVPALPEDSEVDMPQPGAIDEDEDIAFPSSQPEQLLPAEAKKLDVLQRMMAAARSPPRAEKARRFPGLANEFLENEAELDLEEDNGFFSKLDDEDEDAEGDGVVENLVDDTERSKAQELKDAERRAEIDREYAEQEDARRQKIAQEVIDGKHKGRRRDGLDGVLSSDDEDDEDKRKAKRRWREMQKKRTIAQGETQAFVQAYQGGLASDDSDDDMEADQSQPMPEDERGKDDDEAEDAPTIRNSKPMAIREIESQVRRLARQTREREEALDDEPIDLENTKMAFVDSDTDQEESQITISRRRDDQRSFITDSGNKDSKYERWAATADTTDSRRVGANSSVMGGGNSLGRTASTSNRSGSFMSAAKGGKKSDKAALKPRASAVMGGVMAKMGGFEKNP
ncbi:hypothetical protein QFC22_001219 [Naganishia vaughanmartiniae]|uniref:Uncharacterized protein n=1 Tax=Naganishia vaughanmartiniae TaxID=1424756 RepID=A0ACC2XI07_9TREE|nr:hypothetical protein QFC22_001219 [Naganishia vaughanmartiniae]